MSEDEEWRPSHPGKGRQRKRGGQGADKNGFALSPYKRSSEFKSPHCCLPWCPHYDQAQTRPQPRFITFPIQRERQTEWIRTLRMELVLSNVSAWDLFKSYYLCENHFESNEIMNMANNPSIVPTRNLEGMLCTFYNQSEDKTLSAIVKRENEVYCAVFGCRNQFRDSADCEIAMYPFPKDPNRRKLWVTNVKRYNQNRSGNPIFENHLSEEDWRNKYICSEHFELHDISYKSGEFFTTYEINPAVIPFAGDQGIDTDVVDSDQTSAPEPGVPLEGRNGILEESDSGVGNMEVESNQAYDGEVDADTQTDYSSGRDMKYAPPEIVTLSDDEEDNTQISVDEDTTKTTIPADVPAVEFDSASSGMGGQPPAITTILLPPAKGAVPNNLCVLPPSPVPLLEHRTASMSTPPRINKQIPLVTKCYIIDAIQEFHKTLCHQFSLTRSDLNNIWDNRRSVLSKDVLGED